MTKISNKDFSHSAWFLLPFFVSFVNFLFIIFGEKLSKKAEWKLNYILNDFFFVSRSLAASLPLFGFPWAQRSGGTKAEKEAGSEGIFDEWEGLTFVCRKTGKTSIINLQQTKRRLIKWSVERAPPFSVFPFYHPPTLSPSPSPSPSSSHA